MGELAGAHPAVRAILTKVALDSDTVTSESIAALRGSVAGLALKPARYGGLAKRTDEFIAEICELAALDGSLGWLAAISNAAADEVAGLPAYAADIVWRSQPEALIASSFRGAGRLARGSLTGRWESVVGAEYADWLLLSADDGSESRVLVPRAAVRVEPAVDHPGLDAAGVCDVAVSDLTVDDDHVFRGPSVGTAVAEAAAAAAVVGSADGVWRRHVGQVRARLATSYGGDDVTDPACAHIARAASDIDAAKLQILTAIHRSDDPTARGWHRQAVARARAAADRLLASSRHALDASDPVSRLWRDVQAGCRLAVRLFDGTR